MIPPLLIIYFFIAFFLGVGLFIVGFFYLKRKQLIENIPTSKIRSLAMGLVEIIGQVIPSKDHLLKSPLFQKDCIYYRFTVEEYRRSGKSSHWATIKKDERRSLFYLQDETGKVLVDPTAASIEIKRDCAYESGLGKDPPEIIQQFLAANNITFEGLLGINKTMRFRESFIEPNDTLYILGTADEQPTIENMASDRREENIIIKKGTQEKTYIISDSKERDILRNLTMKMSIFFVIGSLLIIVGLVGVIAMFGGG